MILLRGKCSAVAALLTGFSIVVGLTVALPPSAHAADYSMTTDCTEGFAVYGSPGDVFTVAMSADGCGAESGFVWDQNSVYPATGSGYLELLSATNDLSRSPYAEFSDDWYLYSDGSGDTTFTARLLGSDGVGDPLAIGEVLAVVGTLTPVRRDFAITYAGPVPIPEAPPASWFQSVERPSAESTCPVGWNPSWAQWAHAGLGGFVCVRELYYNMPSGSWAYRGSPHAGK
jgi:hypothetical protein